MKIFIYKNLIVTVIFLLLPIFYSNKRYEYGWPEMNYYLMFAVIFIGVCYLLFLNIKSLRSFKKERKILPILFLLLPGFLAVYGLFFVLWLFSGRFGF